jgi:DNA-binding NtrC family response regulator
MKESLSHNHSSRILVVDDDPEMRSLLCDELSDGGYAVEQADDGMEAIRKINKEPFDLVITDIRMNRLGGVELLQAVNGLKIALPVILITAFGDWPEVISGYEGLVSSFISKPFKMEDLLSSVRRALQQVKG